MATGCDSPAASALELRKIGEIKDTETCRAYDAFKGALGDVRCAYAYLNPTTGTVRQGDREIEPFVLQQYLRRAVISFLSIWEHYVQNLLAEAFNHVVRIKDDDSTPEYSSDDSTTSTSGSYRNLRKIKKEWPSCQRVIQDAIKRRGDASKRPLEVVAFGLLTSSRPHIRLLEEHREHTLRACTPLFMGPGGIDETFQALFATKTKKVQAP